ncbi:MAG: hypothetical protein K2P99_07130, partial [Burkholderiales bacterium]|nr:hypothetical protein [Burkholderiales bacterium]
RQQQISWNDLISNASPYNLGYQHWLSSGHIINSVGISALLVQQQSFFVANLDVFEYSLFGLIAIVWIPFVLDRPAKVIELDNKYLE